jgi:hypothetical protein
LETWLALTLFFLFPVFFVALWLAVTTLLSVLSGWRALMTAFPDRDETPVLRLSGQSGTMGLGVNMRGVLTLSICPSGLRVGIARFLAPFSRDFLVPWGQISTTGKRALFMSVVKLKFGQAGNLVISADLVAKLAAAAGRNWPKSDNERAQA